MRESVGRRGPGARRCRFIPLTIAHAVLLSGCVDEPSDPLQEIFLELSPETLPPSPPDITNRFADSPEAALLGQRFFFDPGFSGALIDTDNNGTPGTLGRRGDVGKVACSSCHVPSAGFSDTRSPFGAQISLASGWLLRRTPSLLDIGQVPLIMWDGRKDNLYNQVFGPTESAIESNSSRLYLAEQVFSRYRAEYEAVFGLMVPSDDPGRFSDAARFPALTAEATGCQDVDDFGINEVTCPGPMHGTPGDGAEYDGMTPADQEAVTEVVVNVGKAMAAYQRLLSCGPSRFDAWVHGDEAALSEAEQRGAALFVGKAKCVTCHSGPYFSDQEFHNVGLEPASIQASGFIDADDRGAAVGLATAIADPLNTRGVWSDAEGGDGRLPSEVPEGMEGAFRTPMLRCGAARPAFMHTGQFKTLREVVAFFSRGGSPSGYPGHNELEPLNLTREEQDDLVAFLRALDGPGPDERLLSSP